MAYKSCKKMIPIAALFVVVCVACSMSKMQTISEGLTNPTWTTADGLDIWNYYKNTTSEGSDIWKKPINTTLQDCQSKCANQTTPACAGIVWNTTADNITNKKKTANCSLKSVFVGPQTGDVKSQLYTYGANN